MSDEDAIHLHCIMERVKPGGRPSCFKLWACRDNSRDCLGHRRRSKHCGQCIEGRPQETLGQLCERVAAGPIQ